MSHTSFAFQVLMFVQGTSCRAFIKPAPKSTLPSKSYTQGSFLERKNHRRGWRAIKTLSKISKWHWDVEEKMKFVCALWNACDCVRWGFGWGLCGNWPSITCGRDIDTPGRTRAHSCVEPYDHQPGHHNWCRTNIRTRKLCQDIRSCWWAWHSWTRTLNL